MKTIDNPFDPNMEQQDHEHDIEQQEQEQYLKRRKRLIRILALITAMSFLIMIFSSLFSFLSFPSVKILTESYRLSRQSNVNEWKQAVHSLSVEGRSGTGFLIASGQFMITNHHIVKNDENVRILPLSRKDVELIDFDHYPEIDVTIIQLNENQLPSLEFEKTLDLKENDPFYIIGNPYGFFRITTKAYFKGYAQVAGWDIPVLMLKGNVYQGNSGSPVINENGKVVGVIFATATFDGDESVALAIPSNEILSVIYLSD